MSHAFDAFAREQAGNGFSAATIRARISAIRSAARHAGVPPDELTRDHVVAWLAAGQYAPATRACYLSHLTAWSEHLDRPELVFRIRRTTPPPSHPDPLPEDELERLLEAVAVDQVLTAWVLLGAYAGLRAHETAQMASTDRRGDMVRVKGKGGRTDVLPIPPRLEASLQPFAGVDGPLWPGTRPRQVSERVGRVAARIGLRRFRYHRLRHRFGTAVYRASHDLLLTQQLMRHQSPVTTQGYAAVAADSGRTTVRSLPGAGEIT